MGTFLVAVYKDQLALGIGNTPERAVHDALVSNADRFKGAGDVRHLFKTYHCLREHVRRVADGDTTWPIRI